MCYLSATQVVASALNKLEVTDISVSRLVNYNKFLLEILSDYYGVVDIGELCFEIPWLAPELEIKENADNETVVSIKENEVFDYKRYKMTLPTDVAEILETSSVPHNI